jgi:serine phosphatase RsbU (regulator of sigma subunit)
MTEEAPRILAVDDDRGLLRVVERVLAPHYPVTLARGFLPALAKLEEEGPFDIAVIDIRMPDGDGYELGRRIREEHPETDVILMTGSVTHQDQKLLQALEEDVFFFLLKPFHRSVLLALVERCVRKRHLEAENRRQRRILEEDQKKAREIQIHLLPETPYDFNGWAIDARFLSCDETSGDLYALFPCAAPHLGLALLDISGHGLPAAMYGGMLRAALDAACRTDPFPKAVFDQIYSGLDFFAHNRGGTMIYLLLRQGGDVPYFNAGHLPALLHRGDGTLQELTSTGPLLTPAPWAAGIPRGAATKSLHPGDRLLLYTDGLVETQDPAGREFGFEDLKRTFLETRSLSIAQALDHLLRRLDEHRAGRPLEDDVTLVLVERVGQTS